MSIEAQSIIKKSLETKNTKLDLSFCKIESLLAIPEILKCTHITELDLSNNKIKKIEGLDSLANLSELDLHNNNIAKIEGLHSLSNLSSLSLSSNKIAKIEGLDSLSNLSKLYLSCNEIDSLQKREIESFLKIIKKLETLHINDNPFLRQYGLKLDKDLLGNSNHKTSMISLLSNIIADNMKEYSFPVKILIVGNHAAGKSSLVHYLQKNMLAENRESNHQIYTIDFSIDYWLEQIAKLSHTYTSSSENTKDPQHKKNTFIIQSHTDEHTKEFVPHKENLIEDFFLCLKKSDNPKRNKKKRMPLLVLVKHTRVHYGAIHLMKH